MKNENKGQKNRKFFSYDFLKENRKAMSAVVTLMLMLLLVVAAASIVWVVIDKTVKNDMASSESCYDILGKITINSEYTCYNASNDRVLFSVSIGDAEIDELRVSIANEEYSTSFTLSNESQTIAGLTNYPSESGIIQLPGENSGKTYIASNILVTPLKIEIASIIAGKACETSDSLTDIPACSELSL